MLCSHCSRLCARGIQESPGWQEDATIRDSCVKMSSAHSQSLSVAVAVRVFKTELEGPPCSAYCHSAGARSFVDKARGLGVGGVQKS